MKTRKYEKDKPLIIECEAEGQPEPMWVFYFEIFMKNELKFRSIERKKKNNTFQTPYIKGDILIQLKN